MRRRRRITFRDSSSNAVGTALLGAVAGLALGVLIMHKTGGLEPVLAGLRARFQRNDDDDEYEGPPESVYHMNQFVHDDSDYGDVVDTIESDPQEEQVATEMETRVLSAFLNDPVLATAPVEISAESDGVVELHGWVDSARVLEYASTIAGGVPGVVGVSNNIRVRKPGKKRQP